MQLNMPQTELWLWSSQISSLSVNGNSIIQALQDQKPLCNPEFVSVSHTPQANTNKSLCLDHSNITQLRLLSHNLHCYYPSPSHHNPRLTYCKSLLTGLFPPMRFQQSVLNTRISVKSERLRWLPFSPRVNSKELMTYEALQAPLWAQFHPSSVSVVLVQPRWTNRPSVLLSTLPAGLLSEIHTWLIADFCSPLEVPHGTALPWLWECPPRPLSSTLSVSFPCCVFLHSTYYQILEIGTCCSLLTAVSPVHTTLMTSVDGWMCKVTWVVEAL